MTRIVGKKIVTLKRRDDLKRNESHGKNKCFMHQDAYRLTNLVRLDVQVTPSMKGIHPVEYLLCPYGGNLLPAPGPGVNDGVEDASGRAQPLVGPALIEGVHVLQDRLCPLSGPPPLPALGPGVARHGVHLGRGPDAREGIPRPFLVLGAVEP